MRDKMREKTVYEKNRTKRWANKTKVLEKIAPDNAAFNIKHDIGGIIDIEFIVQFLVLSNAHNFSDLAFYSDNIRILECLKNNKVISPEDADNLTKIYINYRSELHRLQLQKLPLLSISLEHSTAREQVSDAWSRLLYGN
jgi:glutamate-ammonia-ligase adenylyltransferase